MDGKIIIFTSSYSTNKKIWKESNLVKDFLNVRKIPFFEIDLATHPRAKEELLKRLPEEYKAPPILPPQVFLNNEYLGNYESFFMATEMEFPYTFFKQEPPAGSREEQRVIEYKSKNKAIPSFI